MDTSDTSDFESADEFCSDSEIGPAKNNSLKEDTKVEKNLSEFGIHGTDRAKDEENIQNLQKPEQCWEPGIDYDEKRDAIRHCVVKKIETMTHAVQDNENKEGNVCVVSRDITEEPEMRPPPMITSCWIPELHEANIKRGPSNFVPGPPKFDRDGNPIVPKQHDVEDKQTVTRKDDAENKNKETMLKNPSPNSQMHIARIKTTCWVPALNEVNRKRLENEKHPPKPPTVDQDGNPIVHKNIQDVKTAQEQKVLVPEEGSDNLWGTDKTWDEKVKENDGKASEIVKSAFGVEKAAQSKLEPEKREKDAILWDDSDQWVVEEPNLTEQVNLWKDDFGLWGDDETWSNNEVSKKPLNVNKNHEPSSKPESSISSDDNMWENDQWESVENVPQEIKLVERALDNQNQQTWSNWGIFSVLNTVSQGLTNVIGVPEPEDLARQHSAQEDENHSKELAVEKGTSDSGESFVGLGTLVSGVTRLVESTGTKVISGGLETLETIGKKTMEVLQENDPGLKKKRAFLKKIEPEKPVLSQVLREAKEKAEMTGACAGEGGRKERAVSYEILFDDYQGLVHLEALSMISRQCTIKLNTITTHLSGAALTDLQETLDQVKELCELPTDDATSDQINTITPIEFNEATLAAIGDLNVPISFVAFLEAWEALTVAEEEVDESAKDVYRRDVETLARFTAMAVEQMHKAGEMLLVKEHRSTVDEADGLVQISSMVISMLNTLTTQFTDKLSHFSEEESKEVNQYITNIFFESSTSIQYIQQAFDLLIPVLQVGAT